MKKPTKKKISHYILTGLDRYSTFLKYFFISTTVFQFILALVFNVLRSEPVINDFQWDKIIMLYLTFSHFVIMYLVEIIFASEIGEIIWKNTLALSVILMLMYIFRFARINGNSKLLVPTFTPIFLIAFWYYFRKEHKLLYRIKENFDIIS